MVTQPVAATLIINTPHSESYIQIKDITPILNQFNKLPEHIWNDKETQKSIALQCANDYPRDIQYDTDEVHIVFDPDQETNYIDYVLNRNRNEPDFKIIGPTDITQNEILQCLQKGIFVICDYNNELICKVKGSIIDDNLWFYFNQHATDSYETAATYLKTHSQNDCAKRITKTLYDFRYDDAFLNDEWQIYRDVVNMALKIHQ